MAIEFISSQYYIASRIDNCFGYPKERIALCSKNVWRKKDDVSIVEHEPKHKDNCSTEICTNTALREW